MTDAGLRALARRWMADDPDPQTRAATAALLDGDDVEGLRAAFGERLMFGTAGMRGRLGPGPGQMNQALIRRTSAGFGRYLLDTVGSGTVTVGFDARYKSRDFAEDTARVLAGLGFDVFLYEAFVPTPFVAFAVKHLGCVGGVMVTASHNPPQDNGYKVYWGDGAQIVPPHDAGISDCIDAIESLVAVAVPPLAEVRGSGRVQRVPDGVTDAYAAEVDALRTWSGPTDIRAVYTAMHGVGRETVELTLARNGYTDVIAVPEQADPDPDFPTVAFPNPEEPGALDLALACARAHGADLVLANDPDADRLAVAVPDGGDYRVLTGNQLGVLLADELLSHRDWPARPLVATTVVSSQMLRRMAEARDVAYAETLTGFKWLARAAMAHVAEGGAFVMGYEEAIGYSLGEVVRDKDGVSAALLMCDLVAREKACGGSVVERLAALYRAHGLHHSAQRSLKLPGRKGERRIKAILEGLRAAPPKTLGGLTVERVRDYLHADTGLPASNLLAFELDGGGRVLARPSGTEPKIKFYFEVVLPFPDGEALIDAESRADALLNAVADDFLEAAQAV